MPTGKPGSRAVVFVCLLAACCLFPAHLTAGTNLWTTSGPQPGRIEQIVVDPANASKIYVITPYGGVFNTTNGGATWNASNRGNTAISALRLAIDPQVPATLYVAAQNQGVFKTTDSAETWAPASSGLSGVVVWNVAVDPVTTQTLYAGTEQHGVYKSVNGGASWAPANAGLSGSVEAVAIDPNAPGTLYAATWTGVFKSVDAGATWSSAGAGLTSRPRVIRIDPQDGSTVYVGTDAAGVFKSEDAGGSWVSVNVGLGGGFIADLAVDSGTPDSGTPGRLLAAKRGSAGDAIFLSTDGGLSWANVDTGFSGLGSAVAFHPGSPAVFYAGELLSAFRGSFRKSANGGQTWVEANVGLSGSLISAISADPFTPGTAYSAAFSRVFRTNDAGATWSLAATLGASVNAFAPDPSRRDVWYAATAGAGIFKSVDGGSSWAPANQGLGSLQVSSLGIDDRGRNLYAGTNAGVFRSGDSGATWKATKALPDGPFVSTLVIDPVQWKTVYARSGNVLAKTTDGGAQWSLLPNAPRFVTGLVIDPVSRKTLYAASNEGVYKTVDSGSNWSLVINGLPFPNVLHPRLAVGRAHPATLYFSPFAGAFRTTNGGSLWTPFSEGLYWGQQVFGLSVNAAGDTIYAGTYGGVYSYRISPSP